MHAQAAIFANQRPQGPDIFRNLKNLSIYVSEADPHHRESSSSWSSIWENVQSVAHDLGKVLSHVDWSPFEVELRRTESSLSSNFPPAEIHAAHAAAALSEWIYERRAPDWMRLVEVHVSETHIKWALCFEEDHPSRLFVVFRGTEHWHDMLINLVVSPALLDRLGVGVHSGVLASLVGSREYERIRRALTTDVRQRGGVREVIVCGHSLGGSYAQLFTLLLQSDIPSTFARVRLRAFAFGAPLVFSDISGATQWGRVERDARASVTNFIFHADLVPRILSNAGTVLEHLKGIDSTEILERVGLCEDCRTYKPVGKFAFLYRDSQNAKRCQIMDNCKDIEKRLRTIPVVMRNPRSDHAASTYREYFSESDASDRSHDYL
eukprot:403625_1